MRLDPSARRHRSIRARTEQKTTLWPRSVLWDAANALEVIAVEHSVPVAEGREAQVRILLGAMDRRRDGNTLEGSVTLSRPSKAEGVAQAADPIAGSNPARSIASAKAHTEEAWYSELACHAWIGGVVNTQSTGEIEGRTINQRRRASTPRS